MVLTIKLTFDEETMDVSLVDVKTDKIIDTKKIKKVDNDLSPYAKWFDSTCVSWANDSEYNKMFLKNVQRYCNDRLRVMGHLYLNEVYDQLGLSRTKAGQVMGWIYDEENSDNGNFVDFDIYNERNADFVNGYSNKCILDFNVDGNILNYLE